MRIKSKIAFNHHAGQLPRGAVIEEEKAAAESLVEAGKFEKTGDPVTHKIVDGAWQSVPDDQPAPAPKTPATPAA